MTWAGFDDAILDNPKVARVGPIGFALYAASIIYCARNLTDGEIPHGTARRLLATQWTELGDDGQSLRYSMAATCGARGMAGDELIDHIIGLLLTAGLYDTSAYSYWVHDYLEWNPSREQVLAKREALSATRRESGRRGGQATQQANRQANPKQSTKQSVKQNTEQTTEQSGKQNSSPIPIPIPDISVPNGTEVVSEKVTDLWNEACGSLPKLRKPPKTGEAAASVRRISEYFDGDAREIVAAVRRCAADAHYQANGYGIVSFARHLDRWGTDKGPVTPAENPIDARMRAIANRTTA